MRGCSLYKPHGLWLKLPPLVINTTHSFICVSYKNIRLSVSTQISKAYRRRYSPSEKMWSAINADTAFYNQLVLDYSAVSSTIDWQQVAQSVVAANPGCAIRPHAFLGARHWRGHGRAFAVHKKTVLGSLYSVLHYLPKSLDDRKGDVCDLWVIHHDCGTALVFRSTHSSMDGRGTLHWAEETLRAVRQQPLLGTTNFQSDLEFAADISKKQREPKTGADCMPLTGGHAEKPQPFFLLRLDAPARDITPRLLVALRDYAMAQDCSVVRAIVPTDLRSYKKAVYSTANLTGCLDIELSAEATVESVGLNLITQLYKKNDAVFTTVHHALNNFPEWLVRYGSQWVSGKQSRENRYAQNINLSNLGELNPANFLLDNGAPLQAFFIAPQSRIFPLFICVSGWQGKSLISFAIPPGLQASAPAMLDYLCNVFGGVRYV